MDWILGPVRRLYPAIAGRSRRKEFWQFFGFNFALVVVFIALFASMAAAVGGTSADGQISPAMGGGFALMFLLMFPFGLWMYLAMPAMVASMCRRFHDQDRSAWMMLIGIIPYLGFLILLVFMALPGTPGPNRYGADPRQPDDAETFA